jgi:hypothetical protein
MRSIFFIKTVVIYILYFAIKFIKCILEASLKLKINHICNYMLERSEVFDRLYNLLSYKLVGSRSKACSYH